jgi:hypothetical protein
MPGRCLRRISPPDDYSTDALGTATILSRSRLTQPAIRFDVHPRDGAFQRDGSVRHRRDRSAAHHRSCYALSAGLPAVNGLSISSSGGLDYNDRTLYNGAADIGALEYAA